MATLSPPHSPVFNLPNQLTAARLVLGLVLFVFIAYQSWLGCLLIFGLAVVTDWLDGYLARKQGISSTLGRNLDPLVDKVLICGAYIFLLPYGMSAAWLVSLPAGEGVSSPTLTAPWLQPWLQPWMVTVVVARELIITGLRSFLENRGATFGADWLGKLKMVLQCAALISIFVFLYVLTEFSSTGANWFFGIARDVLIWSMLAATALSGLQYLWRAAMMLKADPLRD
jgi:CDP-diacylglycerol--glycerol-3-phosphate 3-phosphatidyltransferase